MGELSELFAPGRVAVVGATEREGAVGRAITENFVADYDGEVVPVNPNYDEVLGIPCVDDVSESDADLAVVVVPPRIAVDAVRSAGESGVRNVVTDEAPTDAFVERFLVGAMSGESALRHFRRSRDTAVITGGDRSDIQTAALEAPGVKALVLSGGHRPPGAVIGKAEEKGAPVLVVNADTLTTLERTEEVVSAGRTRDGRTVARMRELLFEHADVDALVGGGGAAGGDVATDGAPDEDADGGGASGDGGDGDGGAADGA